MGHAATRRLLPVLAALGLVLGAATAARAQNVIIGPPDRTRPLPEPRTGAVDLEVRSLAVEASVKDRVARVTLDQVFFNPSSSELEGTYLFPLPEGAVVEKFSMWVDGTEMQGELLDADRARGIYEAIVRSRRDPALLEYVGTRLFRARIFPIPPRSEKRVKLTYTEMLRGDAGTTQWRFPLSRAAGGGKPIGRLSMVVDVATTRRLASVFSPTHGLDVVRHGDRAAKASWEASNQRPDQDFLLMVQEPAGDVGTSFVAHRDAGEDGTFMLLLAPATDPQAKPIPRDIVICLDTSGSMAGGKIEQARAALRYAVQTLHPEDRFALVTFATEARRFRDVLVPAGKDEVEAALAWIGDIRAVGGTAIGDALQTSLSYLQGGDVDRPAIVLFLTDGLPTIGERDPATLLAAARKTAPERARVFAFGVGNDVNTTLIDRLSDEMRGARDYVAPGEDIEVKVSALVDKTRHPVVTDLVLEVDGVTVRDVYPKRLPDLFMGGEVAILGRWTGDGAATIRVKGRTPGGEKVFADEVVFPAKDTAAPWLGRLWALRRVGHLMDEIRLHGESAELKDEVVRLAKRHGILTPYTSWLVLEDEGMLDDPRFRRADNGGGWPTPPDNPGGTPTPPDLPSPPPSGGGGGAKTGGGGPTRLPPAESEEEMRRLAGERGDRTGAPAGSTSATPPPAPDSGAAAIRDSMEAKNLREATATDGKDGRGMDAVVRRIEGRTFFLTHGVWMEGAVDREAKRVRVTEFSDEYMALSRKDRIVARILALGPVVFAWDGVVYEVVRE